MKSLHEFLGMPGPDPVAPADGDDDRAAIIKWLRREARACCAACAVCKTYERIATALERHEDRRR